MPGRRLGGGPRRGGRADRAATRRGRPRRRTRGGAAEADTAAVDALAARFRDALQGLHLALQVHPGLEDAAEQRALLRRSLASARQTAGMLARLADPARGGGWGVSSLTTVVARARVAALPEQGRPALELPEREVPVGLAEPSAREIVQRFMVGAAAVRARGVPWKVAVAPRGPGPRLEVTVHGWRVSGRALRALTGQRLERGGMLGLGDLDPGAWELLVACRLCAACRGGAGIEEGAVAAPSGRLWLELPAAPTGRARRPPRLRIV